MILCGDRQPGVRQRAYRCTREIHHTGDHIATVGPFFEDAPVLAQWPRAAAPGPADDDMAIDAQGHPLPYAPGDVRSILADIAQRGEVLALIFRAANGDLGVQVLGPPSSEVLAALELATQGYRRALQGH